MTLSLRYNYLKLKFVILDYQNTHVLGLRLMTYSSTSQLLPLVKDKNKGYQTYSQEQNYKQY